MRNLRSAQITDQELDVHATIRLAVMFHSRSRDALVSLHANCGPDTTALDVMMALS